jgi:hypothetical protein
MDEEDGRLGPQVQQPGRADVPTDAPTTPLRHQPHIFSTPDAPASQSWVPHVSILRRGRDATREKDPTQHEVNHENVPGK